MYPRMWLHVWIKWFLLFDKTTFNLKDDLDSCWLGWHDCKTSLLGTFGLVTNRNAVLYLMPLFNTNLIVNSITELHGDATVSNDILDFLDDRVNYPYETKLILMFLSFSYVWYVLACSWPWQTTNLSHFRTLSPRDWQLVSWSWRTFFIFC